MVFNRKNYGISGDSLRQDRRSRRRSSPHHGKTNQRASAGLEAVAPLEGHAGSCGSTIGKVRSALDLWTSELQIPSFFVELDRDCAAGDHLLPSTVRPFKG